MTKSFSMLMVGLLIVTCVICVIATTVIANFLRAYYPSSSIAASHFETLPADTDSRWITAPPSLLPVSQGDAPINPTNAATLTEAAYWGKGATRKLLYSYDGTMIAMVGRNVYLHDAETLELIHVIESKPRIRAAAFSMDSRLLALYVANQIQLYAVPDGTLLKTLETSASFHGDLAFNQTGTHLALRSETVVELWSVEEGVLSQTLPHSERVLSIAFHPDSAQIATSTRDRTIRFWDIESGSQTATIDQSFTLNPSIWLADIEGGNPLESLTFSPDGRTLSATDYLGYIFVWNVESKTLTDTLIGTYRDAGIQFVSNDMLLTTYGELWNIRERRMVRGAPQGFVARLSRPIAHADGKMVASDTNGNVGVWNLSDGAFVRGLRQVPAATIYRSVAFSPDGTLLIVGNRNGDAEIRQMPSGELLTTLPHGTAVDTLALSPDGALVATGSIHTTAGAAGNVRVWEVDGGALLYNLSVAARDNALAFSPDGTLLAVGLVPSATIQLWDMRDGSLVRELSGHRNSIATLQFSADGNYLFSASVGDESVRTWDIHTGDGVESWRPFEIWTSPVFSADGRWFAAKAHTDTFSILNLADGEVLHTLESDQTIETITFSPDGNLLLASTNAGTLKVWEVETGMPLATLASSYGDVRSTRIAMSPDGNLIVVLDSDGVIRFWNVQPSQ